MQPYIAILIDSFWEAVGNKVLWALLIAWLLILLALAPFGYISERSFRLSSHDIDNRTQLIQKLSKAAKGQGSLEIRAVAGKLDPDFVKRVQTEADSESSNRQLTESEIAQALNQALAARELYSDTAFPTADRRQRLQPLIENLAALDAGDLEELNRELLKLAFPLELRSPRAEQLYIGYAGIKLGEPLGISRRQINQFVEPLLLGFIIKIGLGVVAVFVSLIVTSAIIPDTFKTGSLHLLLSKPISRVWLFLSKFLGGCIFVFVNIAFLLIGLYFIAGLRFGIWNHGLLACIPLLLFVFIIFYSVSALAGLLWGNPIVCVVACMLFWLFCFGGGMIYEGMRPQVELQQQVSKIRQYNDKIVAVNELGQLKAWNDEFSVWQPAIEPERRSQSRNYGPIFDPERQAIISKQFYMRGPFDAGQSGSRRLSIIHLKQTESEPSESDPQPSNRASARQTPRWMADLGPELPQQLFDMFELDGGIIALCRSGLYKLDFEVLHAIQTTPSSFMGFKLPWSTVSGFKKISPPDFYIGDNTTASPLTGESGIVVYSSGNLDVLKPAEGALVVAASYHFEQRDAATADSDFATSSGGDGTEAALVQMNQRYCVLARDGLPLVVLSAELDVLSRVELPSAARVRQLDWIPGTDRCAVVTHTGDLLQLDCPTGQISSIRTKFSGNCISMNWLDTDRLWLGVKPSSAALVNTSTGNVEKACIPARTGFEHFFSWVVKPLYLVNPKPSALDNATNYLLSGSQTMNPQLVTNDLKTAQIELDIWQPIFSNLAFVAVMLGISCIYVARKEF